jgi:hypothetical protein
MMLAQTLGTSQVPIVLAAGRMKTPLPGQARVNTLTQSDQGDTGTDIILTALLLYFYYSFRQTSRHLGYSFFSEAVVFSLP